MYFHSDSNVFLVDNTILDESTDDRWSLQDGHGQSCNCESIGRRRRMRLWFKSGPRSGVNMEFRIPAKADLLVIYLI